MSLKEERNALLKYLFPRLCELHASTGVLAETVGTSLELAIYKCETRDMSGILTPRKTGIGWVVEIPPEMAKLLNVEPGSIVVLYPKEGALETEILPAPSEELKEDFERLYDKYKETCEELKRIGD